MPIQKYFDQASQTWKSVDAGAINDGTNKYTAADVKGIDDKIGVLNGQMADTVKKVNGVAPVNGNVTIPVPTVDTSALATKTELTAVASGSPKGTYATLTALQTAFPTGNTNIYLVTADGKWYYWNSSAWTAGGVYQSTGITDGGVRNRNLGTDTLTTLSILNMSEQVAPNIVDNYALNDDQGGVAALTSFYISSKISVKSGNQYIIKNINSGTYYVCAFYDDKNTFLSIVVRNALDMTITAPNNASYLRLNMLKSSPITDVIETGYFPIYGTNIAPNSVEPDRIKKGFSTEKINGYSIGKNLFDKTKVITGKHINTSNGLTSTNASYNMSAFIEVKPSTSYSWINSKPYAWYDGNSMFISGGGSTATTTPTTITSPSNAKYIRVSLLATEMDTFQLEEGTSQTTYQSFGFMIDKLRLNDTVFSEQLNSANQTIQKGNVSLNLPSKIYALVGKELNIYFDNILYEKDNKFDFDVICTIGGQFENYYRVTPASSGSYPITIIVLKDDIEVARAQSTIVVTATTVGNAITKKILIIGDSTTDNSFLVPKLTGNFNSDVMRIQTIGLRGTTPNNHQATAGWQTSDFFGVSSPFMFSGVFDFTQYITANGLATPDYVFINLGINDVFSITDDSSLTAKMTTVLSQYNTMITSIKNQNPSVKVGICLTIPPNYSQNAFGVSYQSGQTRKRYKRNNFLWVKKLIETFGNREAESLYLVPINLNLDSRNNFGSSQQQVNARNAATITFPASAPDTPALHPADVGYWQIADSYWYFLKSFEV